MTTKPILPDLLTVVNTSGEIHYLQAAELLIKGGTWGKGKSQNLPATPAATVSAYLTTAKDEKGTPLFARTGRGTYKIRGGKTTYNRVMKLISA